MNMSYSFLKDVIQHGVKYAVHKKENQDDTFNFGRCAHKYILEPADFDKEYVVENINRRTKSGKAREADLKKLGVQVVKPEDFERIQGMRDALISSPVVRNIFDRSEKEVKIEKNIEGQNWKGFIDLLTDEECIDYKTCSSVDPKEICRQFFKLGYDMQYYIYLNLANKKKMRFIFQEDKYPYYFRIVEPNFEWYDRGEQLTCKAYAEWLISQVEEEPAEKEEVELVMPGYVRYEDETEYPTINWSAEREG